MTRWSSVGPDVSSNHLGPQGNPINTEAGLMLHATPAGHPTLVPDRSSNNHLAVAMIGDRRLFILTA